MNSPLDLVRLALEAVEERDHHGFTMLFAAQGLQLPPLPRNRPKQVASAEQIKGWAAAVNARLAANKKAKASRKGAKNAEEKGVEVRPGGGSPPRPSRPPRK